MNGCLEVRSLAFARMVELGRSIAGEHSILQMRGDFLQVHLEPTCQISTLRARQSEIQWLPRSLVQRAPRPQIHSGEIRLEVEPRRSRGRTTQMGGGSQRRTFGLGKHLRDRPSNRRQVEL